MMSKKEVLVKFQTITPLWTGDAWQNNSEIRPSSLIGSLRFWFEVICYFSGICNKKDFNNGRFEKEVNRKDFKNCLLKKGNSFEAKIECLLEQGIPLPSIIFGATNCKSLIEIKEIKYLDDYCFGNRLNLPYAIGIKKNTNDELYIFKTKDEWVKEINSYKEKNFKDRLKKARKEWSFFFFLHPYFYGKFQVIFKVEERILESIFYPLLTFMDKYGFWGGKWNIGYGRLKISEVKLNDNSLDNWSKDEFIFKEINEKYENKKFDDFIEKIEIVSPNLNDLVKKENKIRIFITHNSNDSLERIMEELIKTKAQKRAEFNTNAEERHKIFGTTKAPPKDKNLLPQGSKVLPYIDKNQEQLKGGFLSIAGLLNLEGGRDD